MSRIHRRTCSHLGLNPGLVHNYRSTLTCMKFCLPRGQEVRMAEERGPGRTLDSPTFTLLDVGRVAHESLWELYHRTPRRNFSQNAC